MIGARHRRSSEPAKMMSPSTFRKDGTLSSSPPASPTSSLDISSSGTGGDEDAASSNGRVRVAVRVRPFTDEEIKAGAKNIVSMKGNQCKLLDPTFFDARATQPREVWEKCFTFDKCFWSFDGEDASYCSQATVYDQLGESLVLNAMSGYNCSLFAYGQTGSGKTHTIMGYGSDRVTTSDEGVGVIPRLCKSLLEKVQPGRPADSQGSIFLDTFMTVSFCEIYNESVRDLISDPDGKQVSSLKIREHPENGAYVEGLRTEDVKSFAQAMSLLEQGMKSRTTASTAMNAVSSRSHAVFTVTIKVTVKEATVKNNNRDSQIAVARDGTDLLTTRTSKVCLVDLAGSERIQSSRVKGERLREASNINKSLSTLGEVIKSLAKRSTSKGHNKAAGSLDESSFVPYRNSVLTWLLKDSLGGNSKTAILATISPTSDSYNETLSTLRYVERAKRIVNQAHVNDGETNPIFLRLKDEIAELRTELLRVTQDYRRDEEIWAKNESIGAAKLSESKELGAQQSRRAEAAEAAHQGAKSELYKISAEMVTLKSQFDSFHVREEQLRETAKDAETNVNHLRIEIALVKSELETKESEIRNLSERHNADREQYKRRIELLEALEMDMQEKMNGMEASIELITQERDAAKDSAAKESHKTEKLTVELKESFSKLEILNARLLDLQADHQSSKEEVTTLHSERKQLQSELSRLEDLKNNLESDLAVARTEQIGQELKASELQNSVHTLHLRVDELLASLELSQAQHLLACEEKEKIEIQFVEQREELQKERDTVKEFKTSFEGRIQETESKFLELEREKEAIVKTKELSEIRIHDLERTLAGHGDEMSSLRGCLEQESRLKLSLEMKLGEMQQEMKKMELDIELSCNEKQEVEDKLHRLESCEDATRLEIAENSQVLNDAQTQRDEMYAKCSLLEVKLLSLEEQATSLEQQNSSLRAEIARRSMGYDNMEFELAALASAKRDAEADALEVRANLERELNDARASESKLVQSQDAYRAEIAALESSVAQLKKNEAAQSLQVSDLTLEKNAESAELVRQQELNIRLKEELSASSVQLQSALADLSRTLTEAEENARQSSALVERLEQFKDQVKDLESKLAEANGRLFESEGRRSEEAMAAEITARELSSTLLELDQLAADLRLKESRLEKECTVRQELEQQIKEHEEAGLHMQDSKRDLEGKVSLLENKVASFHLEISKWQAESEEDKEQLLALSSAHQSTLEESASLRDELEESKSYGAEQKRRVDVLVAEALLSKESMDNLAAIKMALGDENQFLERENDKLRNENQSIVAEKIGLLRDAEVNAAAMLANETAANERIHVLESECSSFEKELNLNKEKVTEVTELLRTLKEEILVTKSEREEAIRKNQTLILESERSATAYADEVVKSKAQEEKTGRLETRISELHELLNEKDTEMDKMARRRDELEELLEKGNQELKEQKSRISSLRKLCSNLESNLSRSVEERLRDLEMREDQSKMEKTLEERIGELEAHAAKSAIEAAAAWQVQLERDFELQSLRRDHEDVKLINEVLRAKLDASNIELSYRSMSAGRRLLMSLGIVSSPRTPLPTKRHFFEEQIAAPVADSGAPIGG